MYFYNCRLINRLQNKLLDIGLTNEFIVFQCMLVVVAKNSNYLIITDSYLMFVKSNGWRMLQKICIVKSDAELRSVSFGQLSEVQRWCEKAYDLVYLWELVKSIKILIRLYFIFVFTTPFNYHVEILMITYRSYLRY